MSTFAAWDAHLEVMGLAVNQIPVSMFKDMIIHLSVISHKARYITTKFIFVFK